MEKSENKFTSDQDQVTNKEKEYLDLESKESSIVGLALSGGGIRSAVYCLGVLQALAKNQILEKVDYLSTVSGGGYIGSALTWWLSKNLPDGSPAGTEKDKFPFGSNTDHRDEKAQNKILNFLRFHSSYLNPTSALKLNSITAILVRNLIISLFVYISLLTGILYFIVIPIVWFDMSFCQPIITNDVPLFSEFIKNLFIQLESWIFVLDDDVCPFEYTSINESLAKRLSEITVYFICLFLLFCILYSIGTLYYQFSQSRSGNQQKWSERRYDARLLSQIWFGRILKYIFLLFLITLIPIFHHKSGDQYWMALTSLFVVSIILVFFPFRTNSFEKLKFVDRFRRTVGAGIFLYALVLLAYSLMLSIASNSSEYLFTFNNSTSVTFSDNVVRSILISFVIVLASLVMGRFVNVNYLGIHRVYRDRLMELFLPNDEAVQKQTWLPATNANSAVIETMCQVRKRPYHLINTNVVLVDSENRKYRERGGANFIISPLYCGSEATGWQRSNTYMKKSDPGMTLATAMAISGAVANPNAGAGGVGWTRNRLVSIMMSILNLRLGYWAPLPSYSTHNWNEIPNFIHPGLTFVLLRRRLHEHSSVIDLTDGGHFENLGLYELIRRKIKTIIVVDGSSDFSLQFSSLANAIERAKIDFGASIEFIDPKFDLEQMRTVGRNKVSKVPNGFAKKAFSIARIEYDDESTGTMFYIKPTLISNVGLGIKNYRDTNTKFPHQTTADQFFNESQFEAYRELGYHNGLAAAETYKSYR